MPYTVTKATMPGLPELDWYSTPDGAHRFVLRDVLIEDFPTEFEYGLETSEDGAESFVIDAVSLGLPYLERAEFDIAEDAPIRAEYDQASGAVRVSRRADAELPEKGITFRVTAYGPPEFSQVTAR